MTYDILVIGGGPAGIFAAITAKQFGRKVLLIEKNKRLGKKLLITGGGRCNFTNVSTQDSFIANIPGNGRFLYSALNQFSNTDLINFVKEKLNLEIIIEDEGKVFPSSGKSKTVVNSLENYLNNIGVEIIYESVVNKIITDNIKVTGVILKDNRRIKGKNVIVATGGVSYPETGSTGEGYELVKELGHNITELFPSSVSLISEDKYIINRELQGLSLLGITLSLCDTNNKCIKKETGDIIFTHFGISGPAVLKISRSVTILHMKNGKIPLKILIDILPNETEEELINKIKDLIFRNPNKNVYNGLKDLLPEKLLKYIIEINYIGTKKMSELSKKDIKKVVNYIKKFPVNITDSKSLDEATVTGGGIDVKQVNPKTLGSKLIKGLFFAGEVLDVDAFTGGYNIQIAFSTGYVAGKSAGINL